MFTKIIGILIFYYIFTKDTTDSRKVNKDFYININNNSEIKFQVFNTMTYVYDTPVLLNLSCHLKVKRGQVFWLQWLHNERDIGIELKRKESNLLLNITKDNDGDSLKCLAFEDMTGLSADEKRVEEEIVVMLNFVDRNNNSNLVSTSQLESNNEHKGYKPVDDIIEYIKNNVWLVISIITAVVVVILLVVMVVMLCKRGCKRKEDKLNLNASSSNCSVITSDPLDGHGLIDNNYYNMPFSRIDVNNFNEYQEPIDSQAYCEAENYTDPQTVYAQPIPKRLRKNYEGDNNYENLDNSNTYYSNTYC